MGRLGLAFKILFSGETAQKVLSALSDSTEKLPAPEPAPAPEPEPEKPARSEAVTLLAALQRDARFVDFVNEPIDGYSDAQVGAAVREVHKGCKDVIDRMFGLSAVVDQAEGSTVSVEDAASSKYRLTGSVSQSSGAASGELMHHGWQASRCDVPEWTGDEAGIHVVVPAEIQVT
ncbi:MAG: DUF2760 domain-containing protein [Planctomycetaceae bacterium]|nr:DUF2760 domain-containing protein [Planctomycetaceae bacterium]